MHASIAQNRIDGWRNEVFEFLDLITYTSRYPFWMVIRVLIWFRSSTMVESSDPYFPSIGSAVENTGSPDDGTGMQANLKWSHGSDEDHPIQEIQSLCMSCREQVSSYAKCLTICSALNLMIQGTTRILLTSIPYFKEIIIMSFRCEHCGSSNNEVQPASTYRGMRIQVSGTVAVSSFLFPVEQGSTYTVKVLSRDDLDRQVVKSNTCFVTFPEFELTVPAGRGQLTTIEGILRDIVSDLSADQPLRRIEHEPAYTKIQTLIDGLSEIVADTDPETEKLSDSTRERLRKNRLQKSIRTFTIILDDPAGNSFLEFRGSTADPQWTVKTYNRTRRQNIDLGIAAPHDDARETTKTTDVPVNEEVSNEEVLIFPGSCSSCGKQIDTRMKKVNIPYFKVSRTGNSRPTIPDMNPPVFLG